MKRPTVMFLGLRGLDAQGGVETHVRELAKHLPIPESDLEVVGRLPYRPKLAATSLPGIAVKWLPAWRSAALETLPHTFLGVLYAAIRRPKILHIHGIGPNLTVRFARMLGLRVVATHHGEDYNREKWGVIARLALRCGEAEAVLQSNACIAISPTVAQSLQNRFSKPVDFIPNGVTEIPYVAAGSALAKWGLVPERYILNVARLVPEKRQLDLIDAFIAADLSDVKLVLCGGADHASAYNIEVKRRAAQNSSILLVGHQAGPSLFELLWNAGLFVLPSAHEGLPIVLLEAMSCGREVLMSDLPVFAAMGIPKEYIFPCGDIDALSTRLKLKFADNRAFQSDWADFLRAYSWKDIADKTAKVYERVMGKQI